MFISTYNYIESSNQGFWQKRMTINLVRYCETFKHSNNPYACCMKREHFTSRQCNPALYSKNSTNYKTAKFHLLHVFRTILTLYHQISDWSPKLKKLLIGKYFSASVKSGVAVCNLIKGKPEIFFVDWLKTWVERLQKWRLYWKK